MTANQPRTFKPIEIRKCVEIAAGGGLVDVSTKAYREPWQRQMALSPDIAREVVRAMLKAADAAEGLSAGFDKEAVS